MSEDHYKYLVTFEVSVDEIKKSILSLFPNSRFFLLIDELFFNMNKESIDVFLQNNEKESQFEYFLMNSIESNKSFKNIEKLLNVMFSKNLQRKDVLIAIGGGLVTDFGGFLSSIYMRGITLVLIPTTLLGMVDASIGGKTAVNNEFGKNLIGSFYLPKKIYINVSFLRSLDERNFSNGMAEVIKAAILNEDKAFFEFLESYTINEIRNKIENLVYLVRKSIDIKLSFVIQDPTEKGIRKLLNLGHTIGHAIEHTLKGKLLHGECVSIGIIKEIELSIINRIVEKEKGLLLLRKVSSVLEKYKLPVCLHKAVNIETLLFYMNSDKKNDGRDISFVFAKEIGNYFTNSFPISRKNISDLLNPNLLVEGRKTKKLEYKEKTYLMNDIVSSKSISNRILTFSALSEGEIEIFNFLEADDTLVLLNSLIQLNLIEVIERKRNYLKLKGIGIDKCNSKNKQMNTPIVIDIKNSGLSARFLTSIVPLLKCNVILTGNEYMKKRPIKDLVDCLRNKINHEVKFLEKPDHLPIEFILPNDREPSLLGNEYYINSNTSSQFVSSLLIAAPFATEPIQLILNDVKENEIITSEPYIQMTINMMKTFGVEAKKTGFNKFEIPKKKYQNPLIYYIEPDFTALTYDLIYICLDDGIGKLTFPKDHIFLQYEFNFSKEILEPLGLEVKIDENNLIIEKPENIKLKNFDVNLNNFTDCFMSLAVLASQFVGCSRITGIANQRVKECNRIKAVCKNLRKLRIFCRELADGLEIYGHDIAFYKKRGDQMRKEIIIKTYGDHRIAMSFSVLGAYLANHTNIRLIIDEKNAVEKTFPNFYAHFENLFQIGFSSNINEKKLMHDKSNNFFLNGPIFLIGMRNVGKTRLSKLLNKNLNIDYISLDSLIIEQLPQKYNRNLNLFIDENGWKEFRKREKEIFQKVVLDNLDKKIIVDCGGGIIETEENREILKQFKNVIWIENNELDDSSPKPSFGGKETLKDVYERRKKIYDKCSKMIFTIPSGSLINNSLDMTNESLKNEKIDRFILSEFKFRLLNYEKYFPYQNNTFFLCLPINIVKKFKKNDYAYLKSNYNCIELRLDHYINKKLSKNMDLFEILQKLRSYISLAIINLSKHPIILTFRSEEKERILYNQVLTCLGKAFPHLIHDMEFEETNKVFMMKFLNQSRNLILSKHYFDFNIEEIIISQETDKIIEFLNTYDLKNSFKMLKIILHERISDDFLNKLKIEIKKKISIELLLFKMGSSGKLSRIQSNFMCPVYDDKYSEKMAPGQVTKDNIVTLRESLFESDVFAKRFYVVGDNVNYSLSPKIHNSIFSLYGLEKNQYAIKNIPNTNELAGFLAKRDFQGLSITIPYKKEVIEHLNGLLGVAKKIKICNTIIKIDDKLWGFNTDWYGIYKPFFKMIARNKIYDINHLVIIFGSGATAETAFYVFSKIFNLTCFVLSRSESNIDVFLNQGLEKSYFFIDVAEFEKHLKGLKMDEFILFNSLPSDVNSKFLTEDVLNAIFNEKTIIFDVNYKSNSKIVETADKIGISNIIRGKAMLVAQAKLQNRLFTGMNTKCKKIEEFLKG